MASVSINDIMYAGKSVIITRGKVIIDGNVIETNDKVINIVVTGDVESIEVDCCDKIKVTGNVGTVKTQTGDVKVEGNVTESVLTQTGDVSCGNVGGNVKTQVGDIKYKK